MPQGRVDLFAVQSTVIERIPYNWDFARATGYLERVSLHF